MEFFANILKWLRGKVSPHGYSAPNMETEISETWEPFSEDSSSEVMLAAYYDKDLFERARTQWQFGDWESLARIKRESLYNHPQRASLALFAAAGHQQCGDMEATRELTRLAKEWGASREMISQVLIAGVHNTLGKAAAHSNSKERALQHFKSALSIAEIGGDLHLLVRARLHQQLGQLNQHGLKFHLAAEEEVKPNSLGFHNNFKVNIISKHSLGEAWAGNTINTVIFRHHAIFTHEGRQTTAFYVNDHTLRIVQRDLASDNLHTHDIPGNYNLQDAHNSISLGIDKTGHLHVCYDHHASQLRYRRTTQPHNIVDWSDELPMTGKSEDRVTYPTFLLPHHGYPLTLLYRDGSHDRGTARIKTYDEANQTWTDHPQAILSGAEQKPWTSNAYWNHPAIGSDGSLHLSFVWRTHTIGEEERINNLNIGYACSPDNGLTWHTSRNRFYKLPITQVNAETIHPVSPGSNLINQTSMTLDSYNRPHIVFYSDDPDGIPQYQHLWFNGKIWHHQFISQRKIAFSLQGHGTLQIPICRPDIIIDRQDNVYVIMRGDHTRNRMAAIFLPAPDYVQSSENTFVLWDENLGFAEPIIDRERWIQENVLTLFLQRNEQPNHDIDHAMTSQPVTLLDINLEITT